MEPFCVASQLSEFTKCSILDSTRGIFPEVIELLLMIQGASKKLHNIYSENMYNVLNCHYVAKRTEFYLG
jgi:hypothetical protein